LRGQTVGVPVPSGHIVDAASDAHRVGMVGHDVSIVPQYVGLAVHCVTVPLAVAAQTVISTWHLVGVFGHRVCTAGQIVVCSGQTVGCVQEVTWSLAPHRVGVSGHFVSCCGQIVSVPVPSGQTVGTVDVLHRVGTLGHCVSTDGQYVCITGHTVRVPVPSVQTVW